MWEGPSCPHNAEAGGGGPGLYGQLKESAGWERQRLHPQGDGASWPVLSSGSLLSQKQDHRRRGQGDEAAGMQGSLTPVYAETSPGTCLTPVCPSLCMVPRG